ncbi:IS66 family transposase [Bradyrhizobium diazoefficiens]
MAEAVLARIAALYAIEKEIRGADAPARQTTRNERSRPLVAELERFLREQAARLSPGQRDGQGDRLSPEPLGWPHLVSRRWLR